MKLSNDEKALENFNRALEIAKVLDDKAVQDAITKAVQDVNYRIAESKWTFIWHDVHIYNQEAEYIQLLLITTKMTFRRMLIWLPANHL